MDETLAPVLQLNALIEEPVGIGTLAKTAEFSALVYPSVIRQILSRLLLEGEDPGSNADHDWMRYGQRLIAEAAPDYEDYGDGGREDYLQKCREWIDDVVTGFCENQQARAIYASEKSTQYKDV